MSSRPQLPVSSVFNPSLFSFESDYLTLEDADLRYVKIGGDVNCNVLNANQIYIAGSLVDLSAISGITAGIASASKALIVDANRSINNINSLTATSLTGTLQTAAQTNITSLGTLSGISLNGNVNLNGNHSTTFNDNVIITGSASSPTNTNGIGMAFTGITATGRIKAYNYVLSQFNNIDINEGAIYVKANKQVGIGQQSAAYALDVIGDVSSSGSWRNGATVLMNSSGVLQTAAQGNITSVGTLTGLSMSNNSTNFGISCNTGYANIATTNSNDVIFSVNNGFMMRLNSTGLRIGDSLATIYGLSVKDDINSTSGSYRCGGTTFVDASRNGSFNNIAGTLTTAAQANITSLGTLTGLNVAGQTNMTTSSRPLVMYKATLADTNNISFVLGRSNATNEQAEFTFTYSTTANNSNLGIGFYGKPSIFQIYADGHQSSKIWLKTNNASILRTDAAGTESAYFQSNYVVNYTSTAGTDSTARAALQLAPVQFTATNATTITNACNLLVGGDPVAGSNVSFGSSWAAWIGGKCNVESLYVGGALIVDGSKNITNTGTINNSNTTDSSSNTTGAIITSGGIGVAKNINFGGTMTAYHSLSNATDNVFFRFGHNSSSQNSASITYSFVSASSADNYVSIGMNSQKTLSLSTANCVGINQTAPKCVLHLQNTAKDRAIALAWDGTLGSTDYVGLGNTTTDLLLRGKSVKIYSESQGASLGNIGLTITGGSSGTGSVINIGNGTGTMQMNMMQGASSAFRMGSGESNNNCMTIQWKTFGSGNSGNCLAFESYGFSDDCSISRAGVGIGQATNALSAGLHVGKSMNFTYTSGKLYNVSNNSYTTVSSSSIDISIYSATSIWCNSTLMTSSDERLKTNIMEYDIEEEEYLQLTPKRYVKCGKWEIGMIAQDIVKTLPNHYDLLTPVPNKDMKKRHELDPDDGFAWSLNYDRLTIVNITMIKKMIMTMKHQQEIINRHEEDVIDLREKNKEQDDNIRFIKREIRILGELIGDLKGEISKIDTLTQ